LKWFEGKYALQKGSGSFYLQTIYNYTSLWICPAESLFPIAEDYTLYPFHEGLKKLRAAGPGMGVVSTGECI
jgi:hypothetical protein